MNYSNYSESYLEDNQCQCQLFTMLRRAHDLKAKVVWSEASCGKSSRMLDRPRISLKSRGSGSNYSVRQMVKLQINENEEYGD